MKELMRGAHRGVIWPAFIRHLGYGALKSLSPTPLRGDCPLRCGSYKRVPQITLRCSLPAWNPRPLSARNPKPKAGDRCLTAQAANLHSAQRPLLRRLGGAPDLSVGDWVIGRQKLERVQALDRAFAPRSVLLRAHGIGGRLQIRRYQR